MRRFAAKIWVLVASVRLAIALLIVLTMAALPGMLIPQNLPPHLYIQSLGSLTGTVVLSLGLDHVFSSMWFYLLLGALSINVLACSTARALRNIKQAGQARFLHSPADIDKMERHCILGAATHPDAARRILPGYFRRRFFTCAIQHEQSGFQIVAKSGWVREIGSFAFHLSIIILIAGGLAGKLTGYSIFQNLESGEVASIPERTFRVRCDWFKIERNKETIADYKTRLTVLDSLGNVQAAKVIEVNDPLRFKGIRMYQSSYGYSPDRFEACSLLVYGPSLPAAGCTVTAPFDSAVVLPGSDIGLRITRFLPDFMINMETHQAATRSPNPNNPAINVALFKGPDTLANSWVFSKFPHFHGASGAYRVLFLGYTPSLYTGIQIVENPGAGLVWFGIIAMTLAIFALLYGRKATFWISVQRSGPGEISLHIGGASARPKEAFDREFHSTCKAIERLLMNRGKA